MLKNQAKLLTKWWCVLAVVAWMSCSVPLYLQADNYVQPYLVKVSTPVYQPTMADFSQPLGTYTYTAAWQGIPAATLTLSIEQEGLFFRVAANARTYSGIDLFYKLRYSATGMISAVDLLPHHTSIEQLENSKRKVTEISYLGNGEVKTFRQTNDKAPTEFQFDPENFMLEPFSAAFIARALPWSVGETKRFDTFNGKSRYLISLTALDKVTMRVNEEEREVWVISPTVVNLTTTEQSKKLREAKIYVTADAKREILEIVSSVFIGSVTTRLDSFTPSVHGPAGIQVAQREHRVLFK